MKKILGLVLLLMLVVASFGMIGAHADAKCSGPATLGPCTYGDNDENTCATLWVDVDGSANPGCVA